MGQPYFRFLCSDLHLGSANSDHDAIVADFERAKACGARILINGDVFDCIGATDKRFDLTCLHPSICREKDLAAAIVSMAKKLLWPYRKLIDIIGVGNHEETWIRYNGSDPVRRLIEELTSENDCEIAHGSFWGFIRTTFLLDDNHRRPRHDLLYYHGTGGDSPVTKGTIDFNRKGRNWKYDTLTFGHKHNLVAAADQIAEISDSGKYGERRQLNLQTGAYYRNYRELGDNEVLNQSYAARNAHPPKPIGGLFLILRPQFDANGVLEVRQDFATDIVAPWRKKKSA